jgi:hypothetical protein
MKINQNNDISVYRGETAVIDFKISQRTDYYVPFLVSSERVNPMVCITIGSTRRESKNIVSKQLWLDLSEMTTTTDDDLIVPRFTQTVVTDLGTIDDTDLDTPSTYDDDLKALLVSSITPGTMYQFLLQTEVAAGNSQLHFAYSVMVEEDEVVHIDDYDFTIIMTIDETITLDMTGTDYFYQIELMDTVSMIDELTDIFSDTTLYAKLPNGFSAIVDGPTGLSAAILEYWKECIALATKLDPTRWGYRILNPASSPVARVSNVQPLQAPRRFTVQSVVK